MQKRHWDDYASTWRCSVVRTFLLSHFFQLCVCRGCMVLIWVAFGSEERPECVVCQNISCWQMPKQLPQAHDFFRYTKLLCLAKSLCLKSSFWAFKFSVLWLQSQHKWSLSNYKAPVQPLDKIRHAVTLICFSICKDCVPLVDVADVNNEVFCKHVTKTLKMNHYENDWLCRDLCRWGSGRLKTSGTIAAHQAGVSQGETSEKHYVMIY